MKYIDQFIEFDKKAGFALKFATPEIRKEIDRVARSEDPKMDDLNEVTRAYVEFAAEAIKRNWTDKKKMREEVQSYKYDHGLIIKPKYSCLKVSKGVEVDEEFLQIYQNTIDPLFTLEEQNMKYDGGNEDFYISDTLYECVNNGKDFYTNAPDYLKERMK